MKIELTFTQEQLEKIKKIAQSKDLDVNEYLEILIKEKIENKK